MENDINGRRLNNILLDRDLQTTLFPLNLMQTVLFQPKLWIIRGSVIPNGCLSHFYCLLGFFGVIVVQYCKVYFDIFFERSLSKVTFFTSIVLSVLSVFTSFIIVLGNFAQRHNNVLLILKIQQAYTVLKCKNNLKKYRISSWIFVITSLVACILSIVGFTIVLGYLSFLYTVYFMSLIYFDANVIYAIQIIRVLVHELKLWREELSRFLAKCSETDHTQLRKYLNDVSQQKGRLFRAYLDIMEAYKLCGSIFYAQVLLLATAIFSSPLISIQTFIENSKNISRYFVYYSFDAVLSYVIVVFLIIKNFVLLICVCAACQQFELVATDVDASCAVTSCQDDCLEDVRRLCKRVSGLSACAGSGRGLRTRGALAVDAALPLRLLALLATYTAVLLQFAFL